MGFPEIGGRGVTEATAGPDGAAAGRGEGAEVGGAGGA